MPRTKPLPGTRALSDKKRFPALFQVKVTSFLVALILLMPQLAKAESFRLMAQSVPPFSIHDEGGKVSGFSADLYALVFKDIPGAPPGSEIIPGTFKRIYADLQDQPRRAAILFGRTPQREALFKWVGPYMQTKLGVIAHKKHRFRFKSVADIGDRKISTIRNTAPEQGLLKLGLPADNLDQSLYPDNLIKKLAAGRTDLMAYPVASAMYLIRQNGFSPGDYETVLDIRRIDLYFAFSLDFSDREITAFQKRLDQIMTTEAFQDLKRQYGLP